MSELGKRKDVIKMVRLFRDYVFFRVGGDFCILVVCIFFRVSLFNRIR